jgi:hypothetical protein
MMSTGPCPAASSSGLPASTEVLRRFVTDAPYSAVGRNTITRVLADGNRIVHSNTTRYFRDGRGRTRTEYDLALVGPIPLAHTHTVIVINDPVGGRRYVLHPDTKRAEADRLSTLEPTVGGRTTGHMTGASPAMIAAIASVPKLVVPDLQCNSETGPTPVPIQLGEKVIDGVKVHGIRVDSTIPAGQIGNERPITIRSEEWLSARLGVVIAMTSQDPMVGDSSYRLEQIVLAEPDPALFKVPPDYIIQQSDLPASDPSRAELPRPPHR